nr:tyrosine-type recombinase/integrase [Actinopolyspora biskrensis]
MDSSPATVVTGPNIVRVPCSGLTRSSGKTPHSHRPVPLPDFLAVVLQARRIQVSNLTIPVFPALRRVRRNVGWRDPTNVGNALREVLDNGGFDWVTSHVFRKTAATVWDESGLSARKVADLFGHDRVSITQDVYFGRSRMAHPTTAALLDKAMFVDDDEDVS